MLKGYLALLFLSLISVFYIRKNIFLRRKIQIKKQKRNVKINDIVIEYADLQYYINTRKEFEKRKTMFNKIADHPIDIVSDLNVDIPDIVEYHIDNQNVHDSYIQKNTKNTYENVHDFQQETSVLKEEILNSCSPEKRQEISDIIDKIEERNSYVTNVEAREIDVLKNIWMNGDDNVKAQVINELLDCLDSHKMLYCPTGVTARLISAAHVNNPEEAPKSKNLLSKEVIEKFGHYYQDGNKSMAREKTINDYFNIYSRKDIEDIISEWYDHI
jgi:hypothetical protein